MEIEICKNCKCCSTYWQECYNCEDGYSHHDCGEDSCCCRNPEDNVKCDICEGNGGWMRCLNDSCMEDGHPSNSLRAEL